MFQEIGTFPVANLEPQTRSSLILELVLLNVTILVPETRQLTNMTII